MKSMRAPATLRGRLALLALATTAIWVAVLTTIFNVELGARLRQQADDLVRTRAAAVAATVEAQPDGRIVVREPTDDTALDVGIWIYQGATAIERPSASSTLQDRADHLAGNGETFADTSEPHAFRMYALPVMAGDRQVGTVVASVGLDAYHVTARAVLAGSIGLCVLLLGGTYLVTRTVVSRALRPVGQMSAQASEWSEHGTAQRFGADGHLAELAGLAGNLDELLDRQAAVLRHEQQLTAELSHELRTPLARITAETDWLTARPRGADDRRASHEAIATAAAQMQRICETLLSEARTRNDQVPGRCAVDDVARALARRSSEEHPEAPSVTVVGDGATAGISDGLMERILTPLLDNARRYAVHRITVESERRPGGVQVAVVDDGCGVPASVGAAVFEAGRRAHPGDGHDGAGLGLPLARRLARAAGGDITLADSSDGARFVVSLPAG
ncbi:sensor histidine kinase [Saccharothrix sp. ST-888]|uniref:sensor histidine kinase n=1 Tax=Saccharothrix sp. ST-888 TaxID=1427391 RepID=UPI0005EC6B04|nr:HAMP domain-containing sensor histidine kinase [Saccharothrix sp. ST-888]KJK57242.1 histidine kinase [Saccharothrix sp. ST-888]